MKKLALPLLACLVLLIGCTALQSRKTYNSIGTLVKVVDASYSAYVKLVVDGAIKDSKLESISKDYNAFQSSATLAIQVAEGSPDAPAPTDLISKANAVTSAVNSEKGIK